VGKFPARAITAVRHRRWGRDGRQDREAVAGGSRSYATANKHSAWDSNSGSWSRSSVMQRRNPQRPCSRSQAETSTFVLVLMENT
jgi:hypothetical protein